MSSPLVPISLLSPGFLGLNTNDARVGLDSGYATKANNCIIDQYGRLGSRKGYISLTSNQGTLATDAYLETLFEFTDNLGEAYILSAGDGKLFSGTTTLVPHRPKAADQTTDVAGTFTNNRWQFCTAAVGSGTSALVSAIATQKGNPALVWRRTSGAGAYIFQEIGVFGNKPSGVTTFDPDCCLSAFGRVWTAGITANKHTIFFSDLLDPTNFSSGSSGILDISTVVGNNDEIVGLAQHNNFLVIFCTNSVIVYGSKGTSAVSGINPLTMELVDVVTGVGCISRDSIQATGTDLIYLSKSGIRSFNRTVTENSMPMRELSLNIRDDITAYLALEPTVDNIKSGYFEKEAFYILTFPASRIMIYVDLRTALPNGAARVTTWSLDNGDVYKAFTATESRKFYFGVPNGIGEYSGYVDDNEGYELVYKSPFADVTGGVVKKFLKKARLLVIGSGEQDFTFKYGYNYTLNPRTVILARDLGTGIYPKFSGTTSLYAVSKYSSVGIGVQEIRVPLGGSGDTFAFGLNATINTDALSIQKIDLFLKTGKNS
jgi:hypothetical protein|tara:strand:+ start:2740 stop:4374 length:1635 start_codon:yes stop_codon:yes gene_type:complete